MKREEVLKSQEYWTAKTQVELYNLAEKFMAETGRNKSQLAEYLGVSKGYVSQLLMATMTIVCRSFLNWLSHSEWFLKLILYQWRIMSRRTNA